MDGVIGVKLWNGRAKFLLVLITQDRLMRCDDRSGGRYSADGI